MRGAGLLLVAAVLGALPPALETHRDADVAGELGAGQPDGLVEAAVHPAPRFVAFRRRRPLLLGQDYPFTIRQPLVLPQVVGGIEGAQETNPLQIPVHRDQLAAQVLGRLQILEVSREEGQIPRGGVPVLAPGRVLLVLIEDDLVHRKDSERASDLAHQHRPELPALRVFDDAGGERDGQGVGATSPRLQHLEHGRARGVLPSSTASAAAPSTAAAMALAGSTAAASASVCS
mmetsp:Transcript_39280/g.113575  ORF Transcript_39280/g.113575 Transcript_39280/m.113575 type:complete len:232 (+) Transcript_39280:519-1214(+)